MPRTCMPGSWSTMRCIFESAGTRRWHPVMEQVILNEEMAKAKAPPMLNIIGVHMAGPTIMVHGTEEQKHRYLPKIGSGEEIWCQGFSEPNAGSDLAALQTRAVLDGDDYMIDGQKVWTSWGHQAQ